LPLHAPHASVGRIMITRSDIEAAASRLAPHVRHTPVIELEGRSLSRDFPLKLKLELLQHTGSFKPRGAFNRLLSATIPGSGVIAASGGNHGAAVAYAARALGITAEIFVPAGTPATKVNRIASYGARVIQGGDARPRPAHWRSMPTTMRTSLPVRAPWAASSRWTRRN
jgi:threonine dehydratase